jgi:hypothetical protein
MAAIFAGSGGGDDPTGRGLPGRLLDMGIAVDHLEVW